MDSECRMGILPGIILDFFRTSPLESGILDDRYEDGRRITLWLISGTTQNNQRCWNFGRAVTELVFRYTRNLCLSVFGQPNWKATGGSALLTRDEIFTNGSKNNSFYLRIANVCVNGLPYRFIDLRILCLLDRASCHYLNKLNQLDVTLWKFSIAQHVSNAITFILRNWRLYVGVLFCYGVYWCIGAVLLE